MEMMGNIKDNHYLISLSATLLTHVEELTSHNPFTVINHDDVIKWKHFPRYWLFVRGIHRSQRPVTQSFDLFFDLCLNKRLGKQSRGWWFETPSCPLWRHRNVHEKHTFLFCGTFYQVLCYNLLHFRYKESLMHMFNILLFHKRRSYLS